MSINTENIIQKIKDFKNLHVLVVGDVMLDVYDFCYTNKSRELHSEKKGKRAYCVEETKQMLGGAGNVALNVNSLGGKVSLVGVSGDDAHFHTLSREAEKNNINFSCIKDNMRATTIKNRIYIDDEYMMRKDHEGLDPISSELSKEVTEKVKEKLDDIDVVILSDYGKGVFTKDNTQEIISLCNEKNILTIVDFKPKNKELFAGSTLMSPNFHETKEMVPGFEIDSHLDIHLQKVAEKLESEKVVVTLHDQGMVGFDGGKMCRVEANQVQEVDAVGCGDTVRALFALGVGSKLPFEDMLSLANDGAAIAVTKQGTSTVLPEELIDFISRK